MSNKIIIQLGLGIIIFLFSTFGAWYEGSALIDQPSEWKYSTPFTQLFDGRISDSTDISRLDYFVYSAKYKPLYPILMLISSVYLLSLLAYVNLREYRGGMSIFNFCLGILLMAFSIFLYNSPTEGAKMIYYTSLSIGFFIIAGTAIYLIQSKHR